jgi:phenylacetate-CoA ligase
LPVLSSVEGRTTDFLTAADGTILHGLALIYVLRDMPGVANFRIVQESLELTRVEVVPVGELSPAMVSEIESGLRARLGLDVTIEAVEVAEIPREASGKFRYVTSRIQSI